MYYYETPYVVVCNTIYILLTEHYIIMAEHYIPSNPFYSATVLHSAMEQYRPRSRNADVATPKPSKMSVDDLFLRVSTLSYSFNFISTTNTTHDLPVTGDRGLLVPLSKTVTYHR